jgi:hypothetical protein
MYSYCASSTCVLACAVRARRRRCPGSGAAGRAPGRAELLLQVALLCWVSSSSKITDCPAPFSSSRPSPPPACRCRRRCGHPVVQGFCVKRFSVRMSAVVARNSSSSRYSFTLVRHHGMPLPSAHTARSSASRVSAETGQVLGAAQAQVSLASVAHGALVQEQQRARGHGRFLGLFIRWCGAGRACQAKEYRREQPPHIHPRPSPMAVNGHGIMANITSKANR